MLRAALLCNPATPEPLVEVALPGARMDGPVLLAAAAHPHRGDRHTLTEPVTRAALTDPTWDPDRARALARAAYRGTLRDLINHGPPPHAEAVTALWDQHTRDPIARLEVARVATCPTTPAPVRAAALREVATTLPAMRGTLALGVVAAAARDRHTLDELAATARDPHVAAAARAAATAPDPFAHALAPLLDLLTSLNEWEHAVAVGGPTAARIALADGTDAALAAVTTTVTLPADLRATALTDLAHRGDIRVPLTTVVLTRLAADLDEHTVVDLVAVPQLLAAWPALLTCPRLTGPALATCWRHVRATRAELDHLAPGTAARRDLRDATLAIATHPATDPATLAEATTASLADVDPAAADFRAATVLRARTAPTTTPLPDLTDPVAGWAHVWPLQAAEVNAIRALAAALTGGLDTLARAGGAPVAARLLDAGFTGTFDDLVTTTLAVTA